MSLWIRLSIFIVAAMLTISATAEDTGDGSSPAPQSKQEAAIVTPQSDASASIEEPSRGVPAFQPGSASEGAGRGKDVDSIGSGVWYYSRCDFFWCACVEIQINDACSQNFCFLDCQQ